MAVAAKFRKYNGASWEEITFPPSDHTHENLEGRIGTVEGYFSNGNLTSHPCGGMVNAISGSTIGFNDAGEPTILNKEGRYIAIATDGLDGNYNYYDFPDKEGTVVLADPETGIINVGSGIMLNPVDNYLYSDEIYVGEGDDVYISTDGITTSKDISCQDLYVNGTIYGGNYGGDSKYYMHTISITQAGGNTCNMVFTVISKTSTAFTVASLYSKYPSKPFACSGYYNSLVTSKLAFTSSTQARIVYGPNQSSANVAITGFADTVIEVI